MAVEKIKEGNSRGARKFNKSPVPTKREMKLSTAIREGRAVAKYVRISSRKVGLVLDLIRGKSVEEASAILTFTYKSSSALLCKLLHSAEANAVNNFFMDKSSLYVAEVFANQGPTMKRIMPRARGSAYRIRKRTSHITIVVKEKK